MRTLTTVLAVFALCAPAAIQAQGRGHKGDSPALYDGDDHGRGRGHLKARGRGHQKHHDALRRSGQADDDERRGDLCLDRNRDGFCDDRRRREGGYCVDGDRDGRCDYRASPIRSARTLPRMTTVGLLDQRRRSIEQERWLGHASVFGRYTDQNRDGVPERIIWLNRTGRVLQVWADDDRNGRADRVSVYEGGRLVRVVR